MRRFYLGSAIGLSVLISASVGLHAQDANAPAQFPYLIGGGNVIEVGIAFDEAAVRAALPKGLEPAEGFTGGVDIYNAGYGWGTGGFTAGYLWLDLAGPAGPTGAPARYMVRGYYSVRFYTAAEFDVILPGGSTLEQANGDFIGAAGPEGTTILSVTLKGDSSKCIQGAAGMDEYVWGKESGSLLVTFIPAVGEVCEATPVKVEIATDKDPALAGLAPKELLWAVSITNGGAAALPAPEKSGR